MCCYERSREYYWVCFFFFQAEDGIRDLVRSRGLGDVYKRQVYQCGQDEVIGTYDACDEAGKFCAGQDFQGKCKVCLLYTSDAADERSSVDLGGRRIIKKKKI